MKAIKYELPTTIEQIEIHPLADLHIGDMACDFKAILEELEYIKNTENCYCLLDGDLMDTAIASSIGDTYAATHNPMEQLRECVNLFAPIKDKIIAVVGGNHEGRIYKSDGIDITRLMCDQLGIAERYAETAAIIYIRFGKDARHARKVPYSIYMMHGSGGGRKEGGKVNRLADLALIIDADIYVSAHTHTPVAFRNTFFRADAQNSTFTQVEHLFVNTAAWLGRYGGYGEKNAYKPPSTINPVIVLSGRRKHMKAII